VVGHLNVKTDFRLTSCATLHLPHLHVLNVDAITDQTGTFDIIKGHIHWLQTIHSQSIGINAHIVAMHSHITQNYVRTYILNTGELKMHTHISVQFVVRVFHGQKEFNAMPSVTTMFLQTGVIGVVCVVKDLLE